MIVARLLFQSAFECGRCGACVTWWRCRRWRRESRSSAIGAATGAVALAVFGVVVVIGAVAYRTRANHNYWVTCSFHPSTSTIVIEPTHPRFDSAARDLFVRTLT